MTIKINFVADDFLIDIKESDIYYKSYSRKKYKQAFRKDKSMLPLEIIDRLVFDGSVLYEDIVRHPKTPNVHIAYFLYQGILEEALRKNLVEQKTTISVVKNKPKASDTDSEKVLALPHYKEGGQND